jgi:hypothetical protein
LADWWLIVATGPSLKRDDIELFRGKATAVAVNCAVFYAPWAEYLFAGDSVWWRHYGPKIQWYKGQRVSRTHRAKNIQSWRGNWPRTGGNSGHMAIQYSVDQGAKNIALLGFDQQKTEGKAHCHADHPKFKDDGQRTNMANAGGIGAWPRLMNRTAKDLKERGVKVINLSRETALECFPRMTIDQFLKSKEN